MDADYRQRIRDGVLRDPDFASAVFGGHRPHTDPPWVKVTIRPVLIQKARRLQFEYFDLVKSVTKNYADPEAGEMLEEVLALPFRHYYVRSSRRGFQVQVTKKGRALIREHAVPGSSAAIDLSHDRRKKRPLDPTLQGGFLKAVGMMTEDGRIKPTMQSKYRQINEFLRLVGSRIGAGTPDPSLLRIADFGCGNAYLTFALYEYLARSAATPPSVTGVDSDALAIERHRLTCRALGWQGLEFEVGDISGYEADPPPDVVVALHACDTATDEALAKAIRWQVKHVFCAPCCHHHLQLQLDARRVAPVFAPVLGFGVLKERLGDILTDSLRALILRIAGYQVSIVQFVEPEHTSKNLMLIADRQGTPDGVGAAAQYRGLCDEFRVVPYLETLLRDALPLLGNESHKSPPGRPETSAAP